MRFTPGGIQLKIIFLGTGTSHGVPQLLCDCSVCHHAMQPDSKNHRYRCSLYIEANGNHILIDTSMDFRQQMLANKITTIDCILFTHGHADHVHGLPDIRSFTIDRCIPCYALPETKAYLEKTFAYIFHPDQIGGGIPRIKISSLGGEFSFAKTRIIPIPVAHGTMTVYGYRIGNLAYIPDVNAIPESSQRLLADLEVLIIDALRPTWHPTHFSLSQSLEMISTLQPRRSYLIHMTHHIDYYHIDLPEGVFCAYDGLQLEL